MPPDPKVYATSFLCERLLREEDKAMSAIRMVDSWIFGARPDSTDNALAVVDTTFVTILKCEIEKRFTVTIEGVRPDGVKFGHFESQVSLSGGANGHAIAMPLLFSVAVFGVHWMEVSVEGEILQRIPLRASLDTPSAEPI